MNREDRARQFAPFEALSGLREALREKELKHDSEQKREISEERMQEIGEIISTISKGDKINVTCFENGYYITVVAEVLQINLIKKYLVMGDGKIFFNDIYDIKKIS